MSIDNLSLLFAGLALIVTVLALVGTARYYLRTTSRLEFQRDRAIAEMRAKEDRDIAADRIRDAAYREYLDRMSQSLLDKDNGLGTAKEGDPVRDIARARTLTLLNSLEGDGVRKGNVVQFLNEAKLISAHQPIVRLHGANLRGADLRGADLIEADLSRADLSRAYLSRANLIEANLIEANLIEANLSGANLSGAILSGAILSGAILSGAILRGAILEGAILEGAILEGADLSGAILEGANLRGANLRGANLRGAILEGAILEGAILEGAILIEAVVTLEQLSGAKSLQGAYMADGTKHD